MHRLDIVAHEMQPLPDGLVVAVLQANDDGARPNIVVERCHADAFAIDEHVRAFRRRCHFECGRTQHDAGPDAVCEPIGCHHE